MEASSGRRTPVPVMYGGVVLLLLLAGFLFRGFSRSIGDANLSGRYSLLPLVGSHSLQNLTFTWNGLSLHFSGASSPGLVDFAAGQESGDILLASGEDLRIVPGADAGGSLTIADIPSPTGGSAATLLVPFTVAGLLVDGPPGAALAWRSQGRTFVLSLPASARVDSGNGVISLPVGDRGWTASLTLSGTPAGARVAAIPGARAPANSTRLPDTKDLPTPAQLQDVVTHWLDKAYAGWSSTRFSAADGTWTSSGGAGVSEDLGVGLLAESVARGTWKTIVPLWTDAVARARARGDNGAESFATSAFIGGTADYVRVSAAAAGATIARLRPLLAAGDPAALRTGDLVPLVLDHGTPDDLAAVRGLLTGKSLPALDTEEVLGLLGALEDLTAALGVGDAERASLREIANRRVLPLIRSTDAGLFLEGAPGAVDVAASIRCGALLVGAGAVIADARSAAVGRGLLVGGLSLADASGALPASLKLEGSRMTARLGTLEPEAVYGDIPTGRLLPHEIPLARQSTAGVVLWTAADVTATREGQTLRLTFGYPGGVAHYFALQGLGAFGQVTVHGIPWHADPSYAKYSDGWYYDAAARVFYGKLTGRSDKEEIDISLPG